MGHGPKRHMPSQSSNGRKEAILRRQQRAAVARRRMRCLRRQTSRTGAVFAILSAFGVSSLNLCTCVAIIAILLLQFSCILECNVVASHRLRSQLSPYMLVVILCCPVLRSFFRFRLIPVVSCLFVWGVGWERRRGHLRGIVVISFDPCLLHMQAFAYRAFQFS